MTKPPPKKIRCAIYTRKSTEEGLNQEFNSLDAQREAGEAFIKSQAAEGWVCIPTRYDDGGYSGGTIERPALKKLMEDINAGRIDCIVVYKVDRLSRSLMDFARLMEQFDRCNVSFVSVTQQFNTTHSMGRLTLNILLSFAQFEREIIAERTRDKMRAARRKGKWVGGSPILGYDLDDKLRRLTVNETEAEKVRLIFDLFLETESPIETIRELRSRGWGRKIWKNRNGGMSGGGPWTKANICGLLRNAAYVGEVHFDGTVYKADHPPIVERAIFDRAQKLMTRRNGGSQPSAFSPLLRGLLVCEKCDAPMVHSCSSKGAKRYRYYFCSRAQKQGADVCRGSGLPAPEIERFVVDQIKAIGTDPELMAATLKEAQAMVPRRQKALNQELKIVEKELASLAAEIQKTALRPENGRELADLQDKQLKAERRQTEILAELDGVRQGAISETDFLTAMRSFMPVWDALSAKEQERLIRLLVQRVGYDGDTVRITFHPAGIKTLAGAQSKEAA